MLMLLLMDKVLTNIDFILNKKIRLRSMGYTDLLVVEKISDFSENVFFTANKDYLSSEFNELAFIEKENDKFKIKIGNFYICRADNITCSTTPFENICLEENNNEVDCNECKMIAIKQCEDNITLWDIERSSLGFIIKLEDVCLTLGHKLKLSACKETKDQLFGFEDYELMSCLLNLNNNPENYKDLLLQKKISKLIKNTKNEPLKKALKEQKEKLNDVDKLLKDRFPSIDKKPKMKKLWGKLWKLNFKRRKFNWKRLKLRGFCSKWW